MNQHRVPAAARVRIFYIAFLRRLEHSSENGRLITYHVIAPPQPPAETPTPPEGLLRQAVLSASQLILRS